MLPLRYLIFSTLTTWLLTGVTAAAAFATFIKEPLHILAWALILALTVGLPTGLVVVAPVVAQLVRGEWVGLRASRMYAADIKVRDKFEGDITIRAETADGLQVDFFSGLTPEQWYKVGQRLATHIRAGNRSFTFAVVGQTERPILVPLMLQSGYIEPVGSGEYAITDKGADWWLSFAALPYPYDHAPQKLKNLL